jgi:hypothetical protein
MSEVRITGASDDLIEIEGDLSEEFGHYSGGRDRDKDEGALLAFSDGHVLRVRYDEDGIWRVTVIAKGTSEFPKVEGSVSDDTSDVVTLRGPALSWVVKGDKIVTATPKARGV